MGKITALTAQKRHKERVNLFIDGRFAFGLPLEVALSLKIGQELTEADLAHLQAEDIYHKAKQNAYLLLSYRPRSVQEVTRKLRQKKYEAATVERVIADLQDSQLLDDAAFAAYWVEQRESFKPRSQLALRSELQQKGVARELIDDAVALVDEEQAARRAVEKKLYRWESLPEDEFRQKIGRFLQQRGFSYSITRQLAQELWQAQHNTEDT